MCDGKKCLEYRRTKKGLVFKMMKKQKERSKTRNHPLPEYSLEELREWLFSQEAFHRIYDEWVLSGYNKWKIPSCDRLDNSKGYSLSNLRLVTWKENSDAGHKERMNGHGKTNQKVSQYTLDGILVSTFHSHAEAHRVTGIDPKEISKCRRGLKETYGGFYWK